MLFSECFTWTFWRVDRTIKTLTRGLQPTLETSRSDDIVSFSANLGCRLFQKGDLSIFYQHSEKRVLR